MSIANFEQVSYNNQYISLVFLLITEMYLSAGVTLIFTFTLRSSLLLPTNLMFDLENVTFLMDF